MNAKPKVVKDFDKLDTEVQEMIKLEYPYGSKKMTTTMKMATLLKRLKGSTKKDTMNE